MHTTDPTPATLDAEVLRRAPKVVLHDHLDGALRPGTVVELADATGYDGLPTHDADQLQQWFLRGAHTGSLAEYLEVYAHTIAVLQDAAALRRVAHEYVLDLAADGVVHGEVRWAPENHTRAGLSLDEAIEAVTNGLAAGVAETDTTVGQLVTIMRQGPNARAVAEAAVRWRDRTAGRPGEVVGLDLAGPEDGFPPQDHLAGFEVAHRAGLPITVHAGEARGLESIRAALDPCGARRLGHGVRIVDDIDEDDRLGELARQVRDRGIPLELCPTSNVHTGAVGAFADHPLPRLHALGFTVTLNPDGRLMSGISATSEHEAAVREWDWGLAELEQLAVNAAEVAFLPSSSRRRLVDDVIRPGWGALKTSSTD